MTRHRRKKRTRTHPRQAASKSWVDKHQREVAALTTLAVTLAKRLAALERSIMRAETR